MNPEMEIIGCAVHEDGSATILMDMNHDMLVVLARKGMKVILGEAAEKYGYPNTEGTDNTPTRGDGAEHLFGEIPEL